MAFALCYNLITSSLLYRTLLPDGAANNNAFGANRGAAAAAEAGDDFQFDRRIAEGAYGIDEEDPFPLTPHGQAWFDETCAAANTFRRAGTKKIPGWKPPSSAVENINLRGKTIEQLSLLPVQPGSREARRRKRKLRVKDEGDDEEYKPPASSRKQKQRSIIIAGHNRRGRELDERISCKCQKSKW